MSVLKYFILLVVATASLQAAEPVLISADYAEPGGVIQVMIRGEGLEKVSLSLQDSRERTQSRTGGFSWPNAAGEALVVGLLGVPSTIIPGRYRLVADAVQGRAELRLEKILIVTEKVFPEELIIMNNEMDRIYADDSEQKKAEARVFWALLQDFNVEAVHYTDSYIMPLPKSVATAGFGDRRRFRMPDGVESASVHFGRDLWAESGSVISAAGRGRVAMARNRIMTGNTVIIEHLPGVYSLYYHMNDLKVLEGQMVDTGEAIGTIGATGFATGEHLHWEMRVGVVPVDPYLFLAAPLLDTSAIISIMNSTY